MAFIKHSLLVLAALLLVACGATSKKDETPEDVSVEGEGAAEAPLVLIPNPYLANKPSIPGRAKEEFARATAAMSAKEWKQADGMLRLMTETYPQLAGPWVNMGICEYHLEDLGTAEASLQKAIEINPTNMDAYTWLGFVYREQGKFVEAEKTYLAALQVWPHHADSHRNLGILYDLYMGRFEEALKHYKMLQRILPEEDRQVKGWILDLERRLASSE